MRHASVFALFALVAGCAVETAPGEGPIGETSSAARPGVCAVSCMAPPPGCEYKGMISTGPCNAVTCGRLVCNGPKECPVLDCAAPPPGCHYEGMVTEPCTKQTCGTLVCEEGAP